MLKPTSGPLQAATPRAWANNTTGFAVNREWLKGRYLPSINASVWKQMPSSRCPWGKRTIIPRTSADICSDVERHRPMPRYHGSWQHAELEEHRGKTRAQSSSVKNSSRILQAPKWLSFCEIPFPSSRHCLHPATNAVETWSKSGSVANQTTICIDCTSSSYPKIGDCWLLASSLTARNFDHS